jgi:hypothetical protein
MAVIEKADAREYGCAKNTRFREPFVLRAFHHQKWMFDEP